MLQRLRSFAAIMAGFLYIVALSFAAEALVVLWLLPSAFDGAGRTESVPVLLLMLAYWGVFTLSGCYLTARLVPERPTRHALVLGGLGVLLQIERMAGLWDTAPAWYHLVSLALVLPCAWAGGRLREVELSRTSAPVRGSPAL